MDADKKRATTENLLFSAIVSLLGIFAVFAMQLESGVERYRDIRILAERLNAADPTPSGLDNLPDGTTIYRWKKNSDVHYGAVVAVGDPGYSAMIVASFSHSGEVEALAFVGSVESNHIARDDAFLSAFLGSAGGEPRSDSPGISAEDPSSDRARAFVRDLSKELDSASEIISRKGRGSTS